MSEKKTRAVVLHSGGIDSSTCLYIARTQFDTVVGLSIDYGQRHNKEIAAAAAVCEAAGCKHRILEIEPLPESLLTNPQKAIPKVSYSDLPQGVSPTYVPFRNGTLLSNVAAFASANGFDAIFFGAHAEDAHNWAYPDCTPEFIGAMTNAIYIGTYHKVRLHTPLQWLFKKDIIQWGWRLGVPFELTWSCYVGGENHCGECPTCRARRKGFIEAAVIDKTTYARLLPESAL